MVNKFFSFLLSFLLLIAPTASSGEQLFNQYCIGCHINGGNIIRRAKTLKLAALQKNGILDATAISAIATQGKGSMGAYGALLGPDGADAVGEWVWQQALTNWPS
ncbi:cytochrome C6 [Synechococcus lacustris str. Tous]|uniref:Cytochrome C6 n=1 Tax=Synechococcus lacustris str. Tous TaxID=1910958 RepID=A0A2P7EE01_9SYNE|nr:cytochrome C6 [Synechococcus lacustris str. Tous]